MTEGAAAAAFLAEIRRDEIMVVVVVGCGYQVATAVDGTRRWVLASVPRPKLGVCVCEELCVCERSVRPLSEMEAGSLET